MVSRWTVVGIVLALLVVGIYGAFTTGMLTGGQYERTTVTVVDENGTTLATVEVRVADTLPKQYTGLSKTGSLADGEGMLFVHNEEKRHAYVMRGMNFPLDIIFIDANGTITTIHHAPVPSETPSDDLVRYEGYGTYVLEVPMGYTNRTGIDVGDTVRIESY